MKINLKLTNGTSGSQSAKRLAVALSQALGYHVIRTMKTTQRKQLFYGQGVDKITQYKFFKEKGLYAVEFTQSSVEAQQWLNDGSIVFGRKLLQSSCGKGIVVYESGDSVDSNPCPVYTLYRKKKREFRVHVFKEKVVAIVEKKRRSDWTGERNPLIRNIANGYVFCQNPVDLPEGIKELAIKAGAVVQSDFKGVDIGYNEKQDNLFIIEVNAAPGMEGSNINAYTNSIVSYLTGA